MTHSHDRELVDRMLAGDAAAGRRFVADHWPHLRRTAFAVAPADDLAEEIAQEALERSLKGLRTYRASASLRTWLTTIVVRHARTVHARQRVSEPLPAGLVDERAAVDHEGRLDVARWVRRLPVERREVVVLRYCLDRSPADRT